MIGLQDEGLLINSMKANALDTVLVKSSSCVFSVKCVKLSCAKLPGPLKFIVIKRLF